MGNKTRGLALCAMCVFLVGAAVGSTVPEFGDLLAKAIGIRSHFFNTHFLVLGILGIGVALYLGYTGRSSRS
jgi:hypothetical protein